MKTPAARTPLSAMLAKYRIRSPFFPDRARRDAEDIRGPGLQSSTGLDPALTESAGRRRESYDGTGSSSSCDRRPLRRRPAGLRGSDDRIAARGSRKKESERPN